MYTNEEKKELWEYLICEMDAVRTIKGISHKKIADALGVHNSNISKFFAVSNRPTFEMIDKVAVHLDLRLHLVPKEGEFTDEAKKEIERIALDKIGNVIARRRKEKIKNILK